MAGLKSALVEAGFGDVRTLLQSGNLILPPSSRSRSAVASGIASLIASNFDMQVKVLTRTEAELRAILDRNPYLDMDIPRSLLHVVFLDEAPTHSRVGDLDPERSPPDRFSVSGQEIFVAYPGGSGRSKLDLAYFEKVLGVPGTARNWNTVSKLSQLVGG